VAIVNEPMTNVCPVCSATQPDGLLCHVCTTKLERALGDVRWIVSELDVTASKMARIGNPSGGGLARERNPISWGAVEAADTLGNVLTTWAREVAPDLWAPGEPRSNDEPLTSSARILLRHIDPIRRHPAVAELLDEITDAVEQARRAVDRPADRQYLGQCLAVLPDEDGDDVECFEEIWARVDAHEAVCRVCGVTHEVAERRSSLLDRARPMVVTAREAAGWIGQFGDVVATENSIRNWADRGLFKVHPGPWGKRQFTLGALLDYLTSRNSNVVERPMTDDGRPMFTADELADLNNVKRGTIAVWAHRAGARAVRGHYDPDALIRNTA
jgi:hypothetical protein